MSAAGEPGSGAKHGGKLPPGLYFGESTSLKSGDKIYISLEEKSISFRRGQQIIQIITNEDSVLDLRVGITTLAHAENFIALLEILLGVSIIKRKGKAEKIPQNILIFEIG